MTTANLLSILILAILLILFAWLTRRAWGSHHAWKWPALLLAGLLTLVVALVLVFAVIGLYKLSTPQNNPVASIKVAGTPEQIARGQKLTIPCTGCHSSSGRHPLDGGKDNFAQLSPSLVLGTLYAPNLTPAGEIKDWTDGEVIRAIREGVHKSGRALVVMPSEIFHNLSDDDVQSVVAFLRSQPATPNSPNADQPHNDLNVLGALLIGSGLFPTAAQPPITQPVVAPPAGRTAEYGKYLVDISGCRSCHGQNLAGGTGGFGPTGPNLTTVVPQWSEADFARTIREGVTPDGHQLSESMPWKEFNQMYNDDELAAIYAYLHSLPAVQSK